MKLNRDYIIGAFIGGAAVSLLNVPRISSLKEDSKERQAQYVSKVQELDRQMRQAQNKDEIIELQRQQAELTKAEIDHLSKANESLYSRIIELENRPLPNMMGIDLMGMYKVAYQWRSFALYLSGKIGKDGGGHVGSEDFYRNVSLKIDPMMKYDNYLTFQPLPHIKNPKDL